MRQHQQAMDAKLLGSTDPYKYGTKKHEAVIIMLVVG